MYRFFDHIRRPMSLTGCFCTFDLTPNDKRVNPPVPPIVANNACALVMLMSLVPGQGPVVRCQTLTTPSLVCRAKANSSNCLLGSEQLLLFVFARQARNQLMRRYIALTFDKRCS